MIVSNSSPLIALGRIERLDILGVLFGQIFIPESVYQETVIETKLEQQRKSILVAIQDGIISVSQPTVSSVFSRKLGLGEQGVLNLALELQAQQIILDDKKARNEAKELGLAVAYTTDILKAASQRQLVLYAQASEQLQSMGIYLPE